MKKKSGVPRELERSGALCLAFANTGVPRRDDRRRNSKAPPSMPLKSYAELVAWTRRMGVVDGVVGERLHRLADERPEDAAAVRGHAVELRAAAVRIFTALALGEEPRPEDVAVVNGCLRVRWAVPAGDGFDWEWAGDDDALDRPLWPIAQSAAELLTSDDAANVDQCAAKGCFQLFVRRSKRRRWCDMSTCGNRQKGRRHYQYLRGVEKGARRRRLKADRGRGPSDSGTDRGTPEG